MSAVRFIHLSLMLSLVTTATSARVVHALPAIHGERLFKLTAPNGRMSFVFAAAHGNVSSRQPLVPLTMTLRNSCRVYLQGDLFNEADIADANAHGDLLNILNEDQVRTYQRIVGEGSRLLRISPGAANTMIRHYHGDALVRAAEGFNTRLHVSNVREQARLLDANVFDPYLAEAMEQVFGEVFRPSIVVSSVVRNLAEDARDDVVIRPHGQHVADQAAALGMDVEMLVPPAGQSIMVAQLRLLDAAALVRVLDQLNRRLADPGALYVDSSAAHLIAREANARFFNLSPGEYGRIQDLLARSLMDHRLFFAGDDELATHDVNLHRHWFDRLAAAVDEGGAFIVMDIERVVPGVNSKVGQTFLEEMERRRVKVTALSAERAGPRVVQ